jgi:hypothetical protein
MEQEQRDESDYDYYGLYYDQPHWQRSPEGGHNPGGVKAFSRNLKRVRWPLNFKMLVIEKYDGSTNPVKWLEVYQLAIEATGGGLVCHGKLLASLLVIIYQDLAPRASRGVSAFLEPLMPVVH